MAAILLLFDPQNLFYLLISIVMGIIVYFAVMIVLKGVGRKEFELIKNLIGGD